MERVHRVLKKYGVVRTRVRSQVVISHVGESWREYTES